MYHHNKTYDEIITEYVQSNTSEDETKQRKLILNNNMYQEYMFDLTCNDIGSIQPGKWCTYNNNNINSYNYNLSVFNNINVNNSNRDDMYKNLQGENNILSSLLNLKDTNADFLTGCYIAKEYLSEKKLPIIYFTGYVSNIQLLSGIKSQMRKVNTDIVWYGSDKKIINLKVKKLKRLIYVILTY